MKKTTMRIAFALVVLMVLQSVFAVTAFAASEPTVATTPQEARKAVVQVNLMYTDENNEKHQIYGESGYFIDANYVLACDHGLRIQERHMPDLISKYGEYFENNYKNRLSVEIIINRDVFVTATITEARSEAYDFAVLKLNTSLNGTTILALGRDDMIDVTDTISCLGFPSVATGWMDSKLYTPEDVTVTNGTISKFTEVDGTKRIVHDAIVSSGSSGGPTIISGDGKVSVVGMLDSEWYEWNPETQKFDIPTGLANSLNISSIREILDRFGIPYKDAGATSPVPSGCDHQWGTPVTNNCIPTYTCSLCQQTKTDPAVHTFGEWTESKAAEVGVAGEEKRTCSVCQFAETRATDALPEPEFNPIWIIIAVAAVVIIGAVVAIIIVVVVSGKKKAAPAPAPMSRPMAPQQPPVGVNAGPRPPVAPQAPQAPFAPVSNEGAGETTVLNEGAGETTVLGGAQASACTLIRVKTGEIITVAATEFVIGKEKRRVNYCIADNNSISRAHAKIVTRGNDHFAVDMNSTNFTYVNGTKLSSGQEHLLKSGDKIKLSDEEFEFKA